ncbi:MAG: M28 family peptidase [bacterium]|nr:M28 family peptidase [bacterium]
MPQKNTSKPILFGFLFLLVLFSLTASQPAEEIHKIRGTITADRLMSHIHFLASPYCRGRLPGDPGMDVTDKYIFSVLKGAGVQPANKSAGYFSPVKIREISLSDRIFFKTEERIGNTSLTKHARMEWDFLPITLSAEKEVNAPVIFAGFGITAPEHQYDDYKNLDARGKIVLVLRDEPSPTPVAGAKPVFEVKKLSKHGTLLTKILNARKHGAVGILVAEAPLSAKDRSLNIHDFMGGTNWPSLRNKQAKRHHKHQNRKRSYIWKNVGDDYGVTIPAAKIDGNLADSIMGTYSLLQIQKDFLEKMKPHSFPLPGKRIHMQIAFNSQPVKAHNIIFKVEGSDPQLKNEYVVLGAHYDHLGVDKGGRVNGGANDNASGSSLVMELARAFQKMETKPKRSLLFILFTGEEKGLLGSRYFVDHPVIPLENVIAMFNFDMMARNANDQLTVVGKYQFPKLFNIINGVNKKTSRFTINFSEESSIKNSDHFPFLRAQVPCLFFAAGSFPEYHSPDDTVERLSGEKLEKISQMVFLCAWETAQLPAGTRFK